MSYPITTLWSHVITVREGKKKNAPSQVSKFLLFNSSFPFSNGACVPPFKTTAVQCFYLSVLEWQLISLYAVIQFFLYIKRTRDRLNPGESRGFYCLRTIRKCALVSRCKTGRLKELTSCGDKASHQLSNDTISTFIFLHFYQQAGLCFKDRLWSEYV